MTVRAETGHEAFEKGLLYSLRNSLLSPYWLFNVLGMAYVTVGMALATVDYPWNWEIWGLAMATIWLGSAGSNNLDLAEEGMTIDIRRDVQLAVGTTMLVVAAGLGILLALKTTLWFLLLVGVGTFLTLAYDLEWFDGLFHHRDYATGIGNLGFTAAWIPTFGGYLLLAQSFSIDLVGMAFVAVSPMVHLISLSYIEDDLKQYKYDAFGIKSTRDVEPDFDRLQRRGAKQQTLHIVALCSMAIGLSLMFVL